MPPEEEEEVIDRGDDFVPTDDDAEDEELLKDEEDSEELDIEDGEGTEDDIENEDVDPEDSEDQEDDEEIKEDGETDGYDEEDDTSGKEPRIPKARLDEVIAQREREREQNDLLKDQIDRLSKRVKKKKSLRKRSLHMTSIPKKKSTWKQYLMVRRNKLSLSVKRLELLKPRSLKKKWKRLEPQL